MTDLEEPVAVDATEMPVEQAKEVLDKAALPPSIWDMLEVDEKAEEEGKWFENVLGPGADVKIRRLSSKFVTLGNIDINNRYRKLAKKDGTFEEGVALKVVSEQLGKYVIADWRGPAFRNKADNTPMAFTPEAGFELMMKLKEARIIVMAVASNMDNFRIETQAAAEKN